MKQIAKDYESYFSKLLEMLQHIGGALPRFDAYEKLFPNHSSLQSALLCVYLELVNFLTGAKKVFSSSSFRLLGRVLWKSFDQTFQDCLSQMREHSARVELEAKLAHMLEEAQARLELTQMKSLVETKSSQGGKSIQPMVQR